MAELRDIYILWQKRQGADDMSWEQIEEAYRSGQLKAVRIPDSLAIAIEESSRGNQFMRWLVEMVARFSYGLWFHQLPEIDGELERSKAPPDSSIPLPEWETSEGFRAICKMGI
jgi:hypothetical protein